MNDRRWPYWLMKKLTCQLSYRNENIMSLVCVFRELYQFGNSYLFHVQTLRRWKISLKRKEWRPTASVTKSRNYRRTSRHYPSRHSNLWRRKRPLRSGVKNRWFCFRSLFIEACPHLRYQERQLQYATASASDSRKEMEKLLRKLRELEEQMQSDDRVERLENSLKNMQDRADELEFQLSKLKPVNTFIYYFHYCVYCDWHCPGSRRMWLWNPSGTSLRLNIKNLLPRKLITMQEYHNLMNSFFKCAVTSAIFRQKRMSFLKQK